jgi:hypothetical protein
LLGLTENVNVVDIVADDVPDGISADDHASGWPPRWRTSRTTSRDGARRHVSPLRSARS